jgi:hypothetical protein
MGPDIGRSGSGPPAVRTFGWSRMHHGAMSISAAQADAFYKEVLEHGEVWTIRDAGGFPAPEADGVRAMLFWSLASRAQRVIDAVSAYAGFDAVALPGWMAFPLVAGTGTRWDPSRA